MTVRKNLNFDDCLVKPLYFHCSQKLTIGRKRNIASRIATGEFIAFFDDDDMHYPTRSNCRCRNFNQEDKEIFVEVLS